MVSRSPDVGCYCPLAGKEASLAAGSEESENTINIILINTFLFIYMFTTESTRFIYLF